MNNAPLTLILIASLGIVAVISLGVFFAVRPKFASTDEQLAADVFDRQQLYSTAPPSSQPSNVPSQKSIILPPATPPTPEPEPSTPAQPQRTATAGQASADGKVRQGEPTFGQSSKQHGNQEIVSTVQLIDSLRVAPGFGGEQDVRATAILLQEGTPPPSSEKVESIRELGLERELDMHRYGKVVGLAYRKGKLYVPSYQNGNVSVFKADTLNLLNEYSCDDCHIYDMGVLSNGDMILSQGKYMKLTKISNRTGQVMKDVKVAYSTKGVAVSSYDEIFVLSRDHDAIYVYDTDLKELGKVPLDNKESGDCNFLAYAADVIYVSCENGLYGLDVEGKVVQTSKPRQGQYAIGVSTDTESNIFVGQRGKSVVDVFHKNGKYLHTVGEKKDSLWSDLVVDGKYLYVIEYITATIKQYALR